ncbi:hypothetical protein AB0C69_22195 [Actinomadura sp. NPDC048032]|uniref:hypothetical protein n=1 Tax=Actinomadura sp. NPDC048032 TaxID=3155747 RepID=UPI0033CE124F
MPIPSLPIVQALARRVRGHQNRAARQMGVGEGVGVVVSVRAVPGGWAYHRAQRGRFGYLVPCGDVEAAAEQVDLLLKHRMFPPTW